MASAGTSGLVARVLSGNAVRASYTPVEYPKTPVPTVRERHMLSRMGCGFSPSSFAQLRSAGGEMQWFEQQLHPASVPESAKGAAVPSWFPQLQHTPTKIWQNDQSGAHEHWQYSRDLSNYSLLRRVYSNRTVLESMTEFWSHHFHIDSRAFPGFTQRPAYDDLIRAHALGNFSDMLVATSLHPCMLIFLDNWRSVRNNPNENQGRELLELHTVGTAAGYTEQMVKDAAKLLSGHTVREDTWQAYYDPGKHTNGAVNVLGFSHPNNNYDDPGLAEDFLRYLATHPATAQRIARKLAIRFVSDSPSDGLVSAVADAFLSSGTDIKATLRALVNHEEFWASAGQKVRTPIDDVVATCRVLGMQAAAPTGASSFVNELSFSIKNTLVYQWPRPDGPPDRAATWASTTRMLNSWRMHWSLAGGWYPNGQVTYRKGPSFLPKPKLRFDQFVDHLSRVVLGRKSDARLLQAACEGCDIAPAQIITAKHAACTYKFPRLLGVLLDSPAHMTR